uniref:Mitochondrial ribosomal protein S18C n=1 Tax=Panagrolaimus sp. JU765 TaxID=591449 RepID=A0AC34Q4B6_9BILA
MLSLRKFRALSFSTVRRYSTLTSNDEPLQSATDPYQKLECKCLLCQHNIELNYKNPRLLQQYVSSFSGRVFERHITGLCTKQHQRLLQTIALSRKAGLMPIFTKDPKYINDPKLFDPFKPRTPHSYA